MVQGPITQVEPRAKSSCVGARIDSHRQWLSLYRADPDGMARTIALDERLRDPARVAVEKNGNPKYLHTSLRPLGQVLAELDVQDRMQGRLFDEDATAQRVCQRVQRLLQHAN